MVHVSINFIKQSVTERERERERIRQGAPTPIIVCVCARAGGGSVHTAVSSRDLPYLP